MWARNGAVPYVCSFSVPGPFGRQETGGNLANAGKLLLLPGSCANMGGAIVVEDDAGELSFRKG